MSERRVFLGIDTATPLTAVAAVAVDVTHGVTRTLADVAHRDARRHGEVLPTMICDVLAAAALRVDDLTDIAVGVGPGAYTGLRVGIATAEALALSLGVPVWGALTVDAIAIETGRTSPFAVVTDARCI